MFTGNGRGRTICPSESTLRRRGLPSPYEPTKQKRERHELTHWPRRRWCSVCVQAKGKHSPHPAIQDRKPVIQIDLAFLSTKEQPGAALTVFTVIDVKTQNIQDFTQLYTS